MKILNRRLETVIKSWLFRGKVISLYGPRQVGKTTLAKKLLSQYGDETNYYDCELSSVRHVLETQNLTEYQRLFSDAKLIVLDEAQQVTQIGTILKLLHDHLPNIQVLATGSSSFDLANRTNEPLTGRGLEFVMYPLSMAELLSATRYDQLQSQLEQFLLYGSYPEVWQASASDIQLLLENLANKYLYKDVLMLESLRKPAVLVKLLQLLALQLGSEVSLNELATQLQISAQTVAHYIDLLEKSFVLFQLKPLSRNLRKEITKKTKIYFVDLGIRNALISQFNPVAKRSDAGALWENFCIIERIKYQRYQQAHFNCYFWRTHDGQEIDYIEEYNGELHGYEFKKNPPAKKYRVPKAFAEAYPDSGVNCIHSQNIWDFVLPSP